MGDNPSDEGAYELAPTSATRPARAGPLAPPADTPAPRPAVLGYHTPPAGAEPDAPASPAEIETLYMPLWLLGGGLAVEIVAAVVRGRSVEATFLHATLNLVVSTALMLAGLLLAARLGELDLGSFGTVVLRLSAVAVAPAAAVDLLAPALAGLPVLGVLLGLLVQFVLYFALLGSMFRLSQSETWLCVWVIFGVRVAVHFAIAYVLRKLT